MNCISLSPNNTFETFCSQSEIVKRLSAIVGQILPFLSQEHQQQVATAVERAKQVTMSELNSVIGVRKCTTVGGNRSGTRLVARAILLSKQVLKKKRGSISFWKQNVIGRI